MREILTVLEADAHATPDRIATLTGIAEDEVAASGRGVGGVGGDPPLQGGRRLGPRRRRAASRRSSTSRSPRRAGVGFDDVAERIARFAEVRACYLVSGAQDLRVHGRSARSIRAVADFVSHKLSTIDRVPATATHFVLATLQARRRLVRRPRAGPPAAGDPVTPPPQPTSRASSAFPPSGIRRFFDIAAEMDDVISLGVGEPDFVTPWRIREAGIYALEHGSTTYTSNAGCPSCARLICDDLAARYGAHYAPTTSA